MSCASLPQAGRTRQHSLQGGQPCSRNTKAAMQACLPVQPLRTSAACASNGRSPAAGATARDAAVALRAGAAGEAPGATGAAAARAGAALAAWLGAAWVVCAAAASASCTATASGTPLSAPPLLRPPLAGAATPLAPARPPAAAALSAAASATGAEPGRGAALGALAAMRARARSLAACDTSPGGPLAAAPPGAGAPVTPRARAASAEAAPAAEPSNAPRVRAGRAGTSPSASLQSSESLAPHGSRVSIHGAPAGPPREEHLAWQARRRPVACAAACQFGPCGAMRPVPSRLQTPSTPHAGCLQAGCAATQRAGRVRSRAHMMPRCTRIGTSCIDMRRITSITATPAAVAVAPHAAASGSCSTVSR